MPIFSSLLWSGSAQEWLRAASSPFPLYLATVLAISIAEHFWPAGPRPALRDRLFNFAVAFLGGLAMAAFNSVFASVPTFPSPFATLHLQGFWGWTAGALAYTILWDLFQYAFHRLQHRLPILWRTHALHHDSEVFHCSDALRNTVWASLTQILFIGVPLVAIGAHHLLHPTAGVLLFSIFGFYNHANLRFGHGPLTPLLSGPQFHRLHHAHDESYQSHNFATFFPCIDMLFGTYRRPAPQDFPPTGVPGRRQSSGLRSLFAAVLAR